MIKVIDRLWYTSLLLPLGEYDWKEKEGLIGVFRDLVYKTVFSINPQILLYFAHMEALSVTHVTITF